MRWSSTCAPTGPPGESATTRVALQPLAALASAHAVSWGYEPVGARATNRSHASASVARTSLEAMVEVVVGLAWSDVSAAPVTPHLPVGMPPAGSASPAAARGCP